MSGRETHLSAVLIGLLVGCAGPDPTREEVATETLAVNVCDETVPTDRAVDGLPAYAQCTETMSANIWSNNGVDTSTSSLGDDWVQTQRGGGYQCTEWAYRYMHFRWAVDYRHGDAREWCDGELPSTLVKSTVPVHGDLIVFDGGVCGADATTGHIAVVDTVDATAAKVTLVEENRAGRRSANQSCATCFLHAVANDGETTGSAGTGANAGGGGSGGAASGGNAGVLQAGGPALGGRGSEATGGSDAGPSGRGGAKANDSAGAGGRATASSAGSPSLGGAGDAAVAAGGANGGAGMVTGAGASMSGRPGDPNGSTGGVATAAPSPYGSESTPTAAGSCAIGHGGQRPPHAWLVVLLGSVVALRRRRALRSRRCPGGSLLGSSISWLVACLR
jgi:hypothetical protein